LKTPLLALACRFPGCWQDHTAQGQPVGGEWCEVHRSSLASRCYRAGTTCSAGDGYRVGI